MLNSSSSNNNGRPRSIESNNVFNTDGSDIDSGSLCKDKRALDVNFCNNKHQGSVEVHILNSESSSKNNTRDTFGTQHSMDKNVQKTENTKSLESSSNISDINVLHYQGIITPTNIHNTRRGF